MDDVFIPVHLLRSAASEEQKDRSRNDDSERQRAAVSAAELLVLDGESAASPQSVFKNKLVLGHAGAGKSAVSKYCAHQWATGRIRDDVKALVVLRLRDLTALSNSSCNREAGAYGRMFRQID